MAGVRKTAVVLGNGSRLCTRVAAYLAENDLDVTLIIYKDKMKEIGGAAYDTHHADTADELDAIAEKMLAQRGRIDYYVHFAARALLGETFFPNIANETWRASKETGINLFYHGTRCFVRPMVSKGGMRVLVIGSAAGVVPAREQGMAAPMSAGAYMLVQSLASDSAQDGIIANALALGAIEPELEVNWLPTDERLIDHIPQRRVCREDEIRSMIWFLLMDAPDYFTGNVLTLDGGLSSAYMRDW